MRFPKLQYSHLVAVHYMAEQFRSEINAPSHPPQQFSWNLCVGLGMSGQGSCVFKGYNSWSFMGGWKDHCGPQTENKKCCPLFLMISAIIPSTATHLISFVSNSAYCKVYAHQDVAIWVKCQEMEGHFLLSDWLVGKVGWKKSDHV